MRRWLTVLLWLVAAVACGIPFAFTQSSTEVTNVSTVKVRGRSSQPSLSTAGNAVFYFSTSLGKLRVSENGGAFTDMIGGGAGTVTSVFGRTGDVVAANNDYNFNQIAGTVTNAQLDTISAAGKVSDSALSANVPLLNAANTFSNTNVFESITLGGTAPIAQRYLYANVTFANSGLTYGQENIYTNTSAATATIAGKFNAIGNHSSGNMVLLIGLNGAVSNANAGTVTSLAALSYSANSSGSGAVTDLRGADIQGTQASSGNVTRLRVIDSQFTINSSGTLTDLVMGDFRGALTATGGLTNLYGVRIGNITGAATPTNSYALYIDASVDVGTSLKYAIHSLSTSPSLITGNVILGGGATAAEFRYLEPSGSGTNYTAFKAVAQGANITYSLPPTVGAAGTILTDVAGDGVLTWEAAAASGANTALSNLASVAINAALSTGAGTVFAGSSTAPVQTVSAQTGIALTLTASNAVAGSVNAGAAAGGAITITSGNAARLTSGNANGGAINLTAGTGIGTGTQGTATISALQVLFPSGVQATNPGIAFSASVNTGFWYFSNGMVMYGAGTEVGKISDAGIQMSNGKGILFLTTAVGGTLDAGLGRNGIGVVEVNTSTFGQWAALKLGTRDSSVSAVTNGLTIGHQNSTSTPAAGMGSAVLFNINSSTTADQNAAQIAAVWTVATHASRTADLTVSLVNNAGALAEVGRFKATGGLLVGRVVVAQTGTYSVLASDTNTFFTNTGDADGSTLTLPTPVVGLTYEFYRDANQTVTIDIGGAVTIQVGASVTTGGGNVTLDAVGSRLRIVAISTTQWVGDLSGTATFN